MAILLNKIIDVVDAVDKGTGLQTVSSNLCLESISRSTQEIYTSKIIQEAFRRLILPVIRALKKTRKKLVMEWSIIRISNDDYSGNDLSFRLDIIVKFFDQETLAEKMLWINEYTSYLYTVRSINNIRFVESDDLKASLEYIGLKVKED